MNVDNARDALRRALPPELELGSLIRIFDDGILEREYWNIYTKGSGIWGLFKKKVGAIYLEVDREDNWTVRVLTAKVKPAWLSQIRHTREIFHNGNEEVPPLNIKAWR